MAMLDYRSVTSSDKWFSPPSAWGFPSQKVLQLPLWQQVCFSPQTQGKSKKQPKFYEVGPPNYQLLL